jgi:hypothetical protein
LRRQSGRLDASETFLAGCRVHRRPYPTPYSCLLPRHPTTELDPMASGRSRAAGYESFLHAWHQCGPECPGGRQHLPGQPRVPHSSRHHTSSPSLRSRRLGIGGPIGPISIFLRSPADSCSVMVLPCARQWPSSETLQPTF